MKYIRKFFNQLLGTEWQYQPDGIVFLNGHIYTYTHWRYRSLFRGKEWKFEELSS